MKRQMIVCGPEGATEALVFGRLWFAASGSLCCWRRPVMVRAEALRLSVAPAGLNEGLLDRPSAQEPVDFGEDAGEVELVVAGFAGG